MTSNDLVEPNNNTKSKNRNKNILWGESVHENIETNDHFSDEILHNNIS